MTETATMRPPILLQRHSRVTPTFESWLRDPEEEISLKEEEMDESLDIIARQVQIGEDYNRYLFSQYVMVLYARIFLTPDTSHVIRDILQSTTRTIVQDYNERRVTDKDLNDLIRQHFPTAPSPRGRMFVEAMQRLRSRLDMDEAYPGISDLFSIVEAMYDDRPIILDRVVPYEITLADLDEFALPTLRLLSMNKSISIDTTQYVHVPDLTWKFIYSLNIPFHIGKPFDLLHSFTLLARLALPLDPIALMTTMKRNMVDNRKAGVPFLNYMAMYLRQKALGTNYTLSRTSDTRRLLTYRMHKFCGVGATYINDGPSLRLLLGQIARLVETNPSILSDDERQLCSHLDMATHELDPPLLIRPLTYTVASEAAKPKDETDKPETDTPEKDKPDPDKEDDAFSDDPDPHADVTQSNNDIIDRQADQNPATSPQKISKLVPLALPTETIDDHLYRLSVLRFVSDLITTPDPDVSNDAISLLKVWCGSLLFIASSAATKSLISQLKLSGKFEGVKLK